jgi:hypothetical protein
LSLLKGRSLLSSSCSTSCGNGDWVKMDSIRASFSSELDQEMRWLVDLELCSCGFSFFCSCLARRWTRVDLIHSFLPKIANSWKVSCLKMSSSFCLWKKIASYQ